MEDTTQPPAPPVNKGKTLCLWLPRCILCMSSHFARHLAQSELRSRPSAMWWRSSDHLTWPTNLDYLFTSLTMSCTWSIIMFRWKCNWCLPLDGRMFCNYCVVLSSWICTKSTATEPIRAHYALGRFCQFSNMSLKYQSVNTNKHYNLDEHFQKWAFQFRLVSIWNSR